jgi:hypothetical protein
VTWHAPQYGGIHSKWLYDGQKQDPRDSIVMTAVTDGKKWSDFDNKCAYMDKMMQTNNSCADLELWALPKNKEIMDKAKEQGAAQK